MTSIEQLLDNLAKHKITVYWDVAHQRVGFRGELVPDAQPDTIPIYDIPPIYKAEILRLGPELRSYIHDKHYNLKPHDTPTTTQSGVQPESPLS